MHPIHRRRAGLSGTLQLAVLAALYAGAGTPAASAAETPAATEGRLEEITVTARKRVERLIDAPLSITAFSASDIEEKNFKTLEDVARFSPGVQYNQMGGQIPGRVTSAIRFRGMNVNSDSPSLQLGALFIDGVFVLGGTQSIPFDDIERIEVIKGPQAALYGRSTFGGAINYITRTPSLTEYSGQVSALTASHDEQDVSASFEGPIVADKFSFRVGGRYYSRGGLYTSTDGGDLGEESSKTGQITLYAEPVEALKIRARYFYGRDSDGAPTGGIIQGIRNDSCSGQLISTQDPAVPVARPKNYICGDVPELGAAISATGGRNIVDTPTTLTPPLAGAIGQPNVLIDKLVNAPFYAPNPDLVDAPRIDHVGLERIVRRASLSLTYDLPAGYQLLGQAGKNDLNASWIRSFGLTPLGIWWSRDPVDSEDRSYEVRITSPQDQRISWLAGASYYRQEFLQSGSGGDAVSLCWPIPGRPVRAAGGPCIPGNVTANTFPNTLVQNTDRVKTTGIFAAVNIKIIDPLTLSLEARRQKDKTESAFLTAAPIEIEQTKTLPRAILRWQPTPETNLYASWAKGVLPGIVNTQIAQATPRELAQYQALLPGATAVVPGDELKMYEIGWKQQWLEGRAQTAIAIYKGDWKYQKGRSAVLIQEDCGSPSHGSLASQGCPNGPTGLPARNPDGTPFFNSRNANVPGDSTLKGVEFEGAYQINPRWNARATVTYAKSEYDDFIFNFVQAIAGFTQMKGNSNARFPEWSGSLATDYAAPFNQDWNWFVGGDLSYIGDTYVDESNLAKCGAYTTVNARAGFEKEGLRLEGFVRNLTDENAWASCARWTDFDSNPTIGTTLQGVAVQPVNPRQYGLRVIVKF